MTPKKQPGGEEPFLNVVARKLGRAAGTLTNVTQGLTGNLSALPHSGAGRGPMSAAAPTDPRPQRSQSKKKRPAARTRSSKDVATARTRRSVSNKSRRRAKVANKKKK
jgi:hypothetical protein